MKTTAILRALLTRRKIAAAGSAVAIVLINAVFSTAQTPANADGWVVLPVDEYRALRLAAFPAERQPEPTPVEATLTRIDYELKIDGDIAVG